jgi:hypothetical protein
LLLDIDGERDVLLEDDIDKCAEEEQAEDDRDEDSENTSRCCFVFSCTLVPKELGGWKEIKLDQALS